MKLINATDYKEIMAAHSSDCWDEVLDLMPTVDAVPVVHGRWTKRKNWHHFVCSCCSFEIVDVYNYCPNCGAKMDRGET